VKQASNVQEEREKWSDVREGIEKYKYQHALYRQEERRVAGRGRMYRKRQGESVQEEARRGSTGRGKVSQ